MTKSAAIYAIVQARMSSERLPGKVLREANGKPLLKYVMERLAKSKLLDGMLVATSTDKTDDPITQYCKKENVEYFRGDLKNVAARFLGALQKYKISAFVRISADSPLIDPQLVTKAIEIFKNGDYDIVTNALKRSFPKGQSVEVVRSSRFSENFDKIKNSDELEHVTKYFYNNSECFKIFNFFADNDCSKINFCVDTQEDLDRFVLILNQMNTPSITYGWQDLIKIYGRLQKNSQACLN